MSDHTHEPSTSNRYESARMALAEFRNATPEEGKNDADRYRLALEMADKLEELIAPSVDDSADAIIAALAYTLGGTPQMSAYQAMFEAGVQYAHERRTSGDRPTRRQMLGLLGLEYAADGRRYNISRQSIGYEND